MTLTPEDVAGLDGWTFNEQGHLHKAFKKSNFAQALALVNQIGEQAEALNHHPDLTLGWGYVGVDIWTHREGCLTDSDFVLASRIDRLPNAD